MQYARARRNAIRPHIKSFSNRDFINRFMSLFVSGRPTFQRQQYSPALQRASQCIDERSEPMVFKYCPLSLVVQFLENSLDNKLLQRHHGIPSGNITFQRSSASYLSATSPVLQNIDYIFAKLMCTAEVSSAMYATQWFLSALVPILNMAKKFRMFTSVGVPGHHKAIILVSQYSTGF